MADRMPQLKRDMDYYYQYVQALDNPQIDLRDTDVELVESLLTYFPDPPSPKQLAWLKDCVWRYLGEILEV